jgi:enoyl-CoA hydratase/carnithine racemase
MTRRRRDEPVAETPEARFRKFAAAVPPKGRLTLQRDGDVAEIVLDHPGAANALTVSMMASLCEAVDALEADPPAAVVVRAAHPGALCSGGDLADVREHLLDSGLGADMGVAVGGALDRLLDLPAISLVALDGAAIGGGAELVTAADWRVVAAPARVHFVHVDRGVVPGWGGARRLTRLVGRSRAAMLLLGAAPLDGPTLAQLGLADVVVDGVAATEALRLARAVASRGRDLVHAVKRQVLATRLDDEAAAFASVWGGEAHRAALGAAPWGRRSG